MGVQQKQNLQLPSLACLAQNNVTYFYAHKLEVVVLRLFVFIFFLALLISVLISFYFQWNSTFVVMKYHVVWLPFPYFWSDFILFLELSPIYRVTDHPMIFSVIFCSKIPNVQISHYCIFVFQRNNMKIEDQIRKLRSCAID